MFVCKIKFNCFVFIQQYLKQHQYCHQLIFLYYYQVMLYFNLKILRLLHHFNKCNEGFIISILLFHSLFHILLLNFKLIAFQIFQENLLILTQFFCAFPSHYQFIFKVFKALDNFHLHHPYLKTKLFYFLMLIFAILVTFLEIRMQTIQKNSKLNG